MKANNKNRYVTFTENDLLHLSKMIITSFYNDELILVVIHGKQGFGKSTYASIVMAQVYGYINGKKKNPDATVFNYDWVTTKRFFAFKPRQFLTLSRKQKNKSPVCCVDDAGLWLNSMDFHHPLVKATGKFLEVARTKWGAILFTCSDLRQIFSKIRNMPHVYSIRVSKQGAGIKTHKNRRIATVFEGWASEDMKRTGRKTKYIDVFYARMPDKFYRWYKPERASLANVGLDELQIELDRLNI